MERGESSVSSALARLGGVLFTVCVSCSRGAQGKVQVDPIFAAKAVPPAALALPFATESAATKAKSSDVDQPRTREWQQHPAGAKGKGGKVEGPPQPLRAHIGGFDRMPSRAEREADAARPQSAMPTVGSGLLPKASSSKAALLQQQLAQGNNTDVTQAINQHQVIQEQRAEKKEKNDARKEKQRLKNKEKAEKKEEERKAKLEKQRREAEEENQKWLQRKVDQAAANKARFEQERQEAEKSRAAAAGSWRRGEDEPLPPTSFQARPAPGGILKKPGAGPGRSPPLDAQKAPDTSPSQQKVPTDNGAPTDFQLGSRGGSAGDRDADWRGNGAGPTSKPRGRANDHPSSASSAKPNASGEMGALAFLNSNFMQQPPPPRQQPSTSIPSKSGGFGTGFTDQSLSSTGGSKGSGHMELSRRQQQPSQPQQGMFQGSVGAPENVAPSVANFFASLQGSGGAPTSAPAPVVAPQQAKPAAFGGGGGGSDGMAPSVASFFASVAAVPVAKSAAAPAPVNSARTSMAPSVANLFAMAEGKAVAQPANSMLGPGGIPFGR